MRQIARERGITLREVAREVERCLPSPGRGGEQE